MTTSMKTAKVGCRATGFVALLALLSACDLFEVTNPGPIADEALNEETAGATILVGLIADIEVSIDRFAWLGGPASTDLDADATQPWIQNSGEGDLNVVDAENVWHPGQLARWGADAGIARLMETQSDAASSPLVAAGYMWAGWANRILGDNVCIGIFNDPDGNAGVPVPVEQHYDTAIARFNMAEAMATTLGLDSIRMASIAGKAQANLMLGNLNEAASLAAQIPDDFLWAAHRSNNDGRERNFIYLFTNEGTKQITVWNTYNDSIGPDTDPRVPWVDLNQTAGGGTKPFLRQLKYTDRGDDIPLAKGHEMRLIEAEVMLRQGDRAGAIAMINYVRGLVGVAPVSAATDEEAWLLLDRERNYELWLEGRRLKDNARFAAEGVSPWAVAFMADRDSCYPPSMAEIAGNPNLSSWPP